MTTTQPSLENQAVDLFARGYSDQVVREALAERAGRDSVRSAMSRARRKLGPGARLPADQALTIAISPVAFLRILAQAGRRHTPPAQLLSRPIETVFADDMVDAVLDDAPFPRSPEDHPA